MANSNTEQSSTGRNYSLRSRLLWVSGLAFMMVALLQAALAYRAALAQADDAFDAQMKQLALAIRAGRFEAFRAEFNARWAAGPQAEEIQGP